MIEVRTQILALLAGGLTLLGLAQAARAGAERGTADDPIIDSKMTEKEAFDGIDPKAPRKLREQQAIVDVLYYSFDGKIHKGQLVIDRDLEKDIREVFEVILSCRFPIASVIPIAHAKYRKDGRWDDELSMAANNTSAFNYRPVQGGTELSMHAHGRAIDINPVQNPYIRKDVIQPPGAKYDVKAAGTLTADHPVVKAFLVRGWKWGGNWRTLKDYQHFEKARAQAAKPPLPVEKRDENKPLEWLKPRALRPGNTIAFVAPASAIEKEPVLKYARQLEQAGFHVLVPKRLDRAERYLAGSDDDRAAELNAAIRDPKVQAIFPCRGGYGLTRILDRIDYAALRADPKIITGFSDLTALHLAVARHARVVTFHSPMPERYLWREDGDFAYSTASFRRALLADKYRKGEEGFTVELPADRARPVKLAGGKAQGRLVEGGNLTLICTTLGTPYAIEGRGNILLLEDTGMPPYQIDRALSQLRLAGILDGVAGIVIGTFEKADGKEVERILRDYLGKRTIPVVYNFPVGHGHPNATLPHGARVELDADAGTLRVLENPVATE